VSSAAFADDLFLGRYRPIRPLGSGGMGHVWLARDERSGLDVALKIVAREGKSGHRAEREGRAAASLRHRRCQRILALARDPSHVYIAYEYVPGRTLREALRSGALDDHRTIEAAAQICDALAHAHARGIVHRDVKPSNVLLAEDEDVDVRLLDFGLAQMAEFDTLTALGDVPGTLAYISPERLLGRTAGPPADVWSVGVLLWEALAGEHPFWDGDLSETSRRIQLGAPPLESRRPDLPRHALDAVASALVLNPQRRPTAERLAQELRALPKRGRRRRGGSRPARPPLGLRAVALERLLPGALAAVATGWIATRLPFYPGHWPLALTGAAGGLGLLAPRAGLLFALAAAFFPLANLSLGLAAVYGVAAAGWAALSWRDARAALLLAAGPLLAPVGALGFVPLAAQLARGRLRRATQGGAAVLLAAVVNGLSGTPLPFAAGTPPLGLGVDGSDHPSAVAAALWQQLLSHPVLVGETLVVALAAALLPLARDRGLWGAAGFGAALLAGTALLAPGAAVLPLIAAAWATAGALALGSKVQGTTYT
jgi:hypothetical protein